MRKAWMNKMKRKVSAVLVCSMLATQLGVAAPVYGSVQPPDDDTETVTLRGRIVSLTGDYDAARDTNLRLYVNGKPDASRKPVIVRSEDTREAYDPYDDSIMLINDLEGAGDAWGNGSHATSSNADYKAWEYIFENLPAEDADGNEYEYTIRDASCDPASPSNKASHSNLASSSRPQKRDEALFLTDLAGTEVLDVDAVEYPAAGARLVYVPYTDIEGTYSFVAGGAAEADPEMVTLEVSCNREADEEFLDDGAEAELDTERGTWSLNHVLQYNPLTCTEIDYRVEAISGYEDYTIRYENRGRYAGAVDYAYEGGTIYHEMTDPGTYRAQGSIIWEDRDNLWELRPDRASFLRVYDEQGTDVTGELSIDVNGADADDVDADSADGADSDVWTYTIDGLTAGKTYTLGQNLPAYAAEELQDAVLYAEEDGAVVEVSELTERLRTRSARGFIQWTGYNLAVKPVDSLDFLRVYAGGEDVTERLALELVSTSAGSGAETVWAYGVDGLLEGRAYTIRAEELGGYAVFPSEIRVSGKAAYQRSARQNQIPGGMLETFTIRNTETKPLIIVNEYYGREDGDQDQTFTYTLKTAASARGELTSWSGTYQVIEANGNKREVSAGDGEIILKENEKAEIFLTVGTSYTVAQTIDAENDHWILYDKSSKAEQHGVLEGVTETDTKTFTNLKKQTLSYQKVWNDNNDVGKKRPDVETFKTKLDFQVEKNGIRITDKSELEKLGLSPVDVDINSDGSTYWSIHYDHLPIVDEEGKDLTYDLAELSIDGYKSSALESDSSEYVKKLMNTSYTTMTVTKKWLDDNNTEARDSISDFKKRLNLYYEVQGSDGHPLVQLQTENATEENYLQITEGEDGEWTITIKNLIQFNDTGIPYAYYLVEDTSDWDTAKAAGQDHYIATYENPHNYINEKDKCYTDGIITNKLEGTTNFTFTKNWKDGATEAKDRPNITFQLMRYPENLDTETGYLHAAPVDMKEFTTEEDKEKVNGEMNWIAEGEELLPRYNAEGVEYVYFVSEKLSGGTMGNSGDYQQKVTAKDGFEPSALAELNKNLVANGEILNNQLAKTQDIPVTKTWKSAAFSNVDAEIVLEVKRRSEAPGAVEEKVNFDTEQVISGFTPETITRTGMITGMPVYDENGYRYNYTIGESAIRIKTDKTAPNYVNLVWDATAGIFKTTEEHFETIQYKFKPVTSSPEDGEKLITNTLEDTMNVRVDKIWPQGWNAKDPNTGNHQYTPPTQLDFTLYQDGALVQDQGIANPVTVSGSALNPYIEGGIQEGICRFDNLPRYDVEGHEYVYTVTEAVTGEVGLIEYQYSWKTGAWTTNTEKEPDTRVVDITNPPPGEGNGFWVEKVWLDDGDKPHRESVVVEVYKKDEGNIWEKTGKTATLTEEGEWRAIIGIDKGETADSYLVREASLQCLGATHEVSYSEDSDTKPTTKGTVSTEKHTYEVTNELVNETWTITNKRIGLVEVDVTKEWLDDAEESTPEGENEDVTNGNRPSGAKFRLKRTNKDGESVPLEDDTKVTDNNASQTLDAKNPSIHWEKLLKYDEKGRLYTYSVEETAVKIGEQWTDLVNGSVTYTDSAGAEHTYVSSITGGEYIHGKEVEGGGTTTVDSGDKIPFHAVNKRQENMQIEVYKLWKDDGALVSGKRVRPDIYFRLYRIFKKDLPEDISAVDPAKDEHFESVSVGKTLEAYSDGYTERYVFDPVPRYDGNGHEYVYFAVEGMYGNSNNYQASYYPCTPEELNGEEPPASTENMLRLSDGTGTVVNMRDNSVYISGEKIWKLTPGLELKPEDYPSITLRLQSKLARPTETEEEENAYTDVLNKENQVYECVLGQDAENKNYNYIFDGPLPLVGEETKGRFPKYDVNGRELAYYVKEVKINDVAVDNGPSIYKRTSGDRSFVLENTYQDKGECSVEITKTWVNVSDGEEGPEATIELWRVMVDGEDKELPYSDKLCKSEKIDYNTIKEGTTQVIKFEQLPKFAPNARLYHYYIKEKTIGGYETSIDIDSKQKITFESSVFAQADITNTYKPQDKTQGAILKIQGIKHWSDNSLEYGLIPNDETDIELALYRSYEKEGGTSTPEQVDAQFVWKEKGSENKTWSYEVTPDQGPNALTAFAKYAPNGTEYTYWVEETIAESSNLAKLYGLRAESSKKTIDQLEESGKLELTNKLITVKLTATKRWEDSNNLYATRPEAITLTVQRKSANSEGDADWEEYKVDGKPVTMELKPGPEDSTWTQSRELPQYDKSGDTYIEYAYRAVEAEANVPIGYYKKQESEVHNGQADTGYTSEVTNTVKQDAVTALTAKKVWEDGNNQDGFREKATVTFKLMRRAATGTDANDWEEVDARQVLLATPSEAEAHPKAGVTLGENSVKWEGLPKDMPKTGEAAEYSVQETITGIAEGIYSIQITAPATGGESSENIWTVTNTHSPISDIAVTVEKKWSDSDDKWQLRPESIPVVLMRRQGNEVGELARDSGGNYLSVTLQENTEAPANSWKHTFENLPYAANGIPYTYYMAEGTIKGDKLIPTTVNGYTTSDSTTFTPVVNATEDERNGSVSITNTLKLTKIEASKVWKSDSEDAYMTRPDSVTFKLYRKAENGTYTLVDESKAVSITITKAAFVTGAATIGNAQHKLKYEGLPKEDTAGETYSYQIRETSMKFGNKIVEVKWTDTGEPGTDIFGGYRITSTSASDETSGNTTQTITNTLEIAGDVNVEKKWDDKDNQDGLRVTDASKIKVTLYRSTSQEVSNPEAMVSMGEKALSATEPWSAEWLNLPKQDANGQQYYYQVVETLPDGSPYKASYKLKGSTADSEDAIVVQPTNDNMVTVEITNHYTPKTMTVTAKKQWIGDGDGSQSGRPETITFKLYQKAGAAGEPVEVGGDEAEKSASVSTEWQAVWDSLPVCTEEGQPITYYVEETSELTGYVTTYAVGTTTGPVRSGFKDAGVKGDKEVASNEGANAQTITVKNTLDAKTKAVVEKVWGTNGSTDWPSDITKVGFELQRRYAKDSSGQPGAWTTVKATNDDSLIREAASASSEAYVDNLPLYDTTGDVPTGFKYEYRFVEKYIVIDDGTAEGKTVKVVSDNTEDPDGSGIVGNYSFTTAVESTDENSKTTITNTWSMREVHAEKVWEDEENRDDKRPDSISLMLYADGDSTGSEIALDGEKEDAGTASAYEAAPWTAVWKDLPVRTKDGAEITYTVQEVSVPTAYTVAVTSDETHNGLTADTPMQVTNTYTPERTSYTVEKLWLGDDDWQEDTRPDSIQLQLYMTDAGGQEEAVGAPVTIQEGADGKWSHTWTNLYKYQNKGQVIHYYAREVDVDGYTGVASGSNAIANTMNATSLKVTKEWEDNNDEYGLRPDTIKILLQRKLQGAASWETLPEAKVSFIMDRATGWGTVEFTGLPTHNKNNQPYEYRALEAAIGGEPVVSGKAAGYEAVYEHHPNLLAVPGETTITNRLIAGSLEISKTLKNGNAEEFTFRVELMVDGAEPITEEYTIKSGERLRIDGIPAGTSYIVTEVEKTGYTLESKTGDTGTIEANQTARAEFVNRKKSSGGGGGGGGGGNTSRPNPGGPTQGGPGVPPAGPTGPADPTGPQGPIGPTGPEGPEDPTEPKSPTVPDEPQLPEIPVTPERRPNVPPGTLVKISNPKDPEGPPLYHGAYDPNRGFRELPPGEYRLYTLDEQGTPLAALYIRIDENGVPLALPKTGDRSIPMPLLAAALLGSAAGIAMLGRRKEEEDA